MKIDKGQRGYIARQKRIDGLWLLGYVVIAVAIFVIGYFWTHTRANVFTVLAVLMVLPGAKRIVALIVLMPRKGVSAERYEKVKNAVGDAPFLTDYVFTSTEKIMHFDFVVVKNGTILAVLAKSPQDRAYVKKYFGDNISKAAPSFHTFVLDNDEELFARLDKISTVPTDPAREQRLLEYLHSMAV